MINSITAAKDRGAIVPDNWENDVELWFESYRKKLKQLFEAYINSLSTCASAFITGPSNFPVARQQKRSQAADKKSENILQFTTQSPDRFLRNILPFGNGTAIQANAPNAVELLQKTLLKREELQEKMKGANKIVQAVYKKGSQSGVTAEARDTCAVQLAEFLAITKEDALRILSPTDFSNRVIAFEKYQLTNNNAEINRLKKRIEDINRVKELSSTEGQILPNGIEIRFSDDGRIEIIFGYKPDEDTRKLLSKNAFKFAPSRDKAWVRKNTLNALAVLNREIKPVLEQLPAQ